MKISKQPIKKICWLFLPKLGSFSFCLVNRLLIFHSSYLAVNNVQTHTEFSNKFVCIKYCLVYNNFKGIEVMPSCTGWVFG